MKKLILSLLLIQINIFAGVNVMAPLVINNEGEWQSFKNRLYDLRNNGVTSISTDVWWGAVEKKQGQFDWEYYDRISNLIKEAGLNWVPIMSFHQCGGNVGDNCNVPVPSWVWGYSVNKEIQSYFGGPTFVVTNADQIKYVSELGRVNTEYPSVWSSPVMADLYVNFVTEFAKRYADMANIIEELNISLGPAGELRYPAYNSHDQYYGGSPAMFPNRGSFQGHSLLARKSYDDFIRQKYGTIDALNFVRSSSYKNFSEVQLPGHHQFNTYAWNSSHFSKEGQDVFDWYHQSLLAHGRTILKRIDEAKSQTALAKTPIGVKVPGIHWNTGVDYGFGNGFQWSHRLTEMNSGLISSGDPLIHDANNGAGYRSLISHIKKIDNETKSQFILHFTCLEMGNNENAHIGANSMAKSLVHWIGREAKKQNLSLKGENALEGTLYQNRAWDNIHDAIIHANYEGLTILRMGPLTDNENVKAKIRQTKELF
jgi:hypothetical protein